VQGDSTCLTHPYIRAALFVLICLAACLVCQIYSWRVRTKDARLLAAEQSSSDSGALKHSAVNVAHEEHKSA